MSLPYKILPHGGALVYQVGRGQTDLLGLHTQYSGRDDPPLLRLWLANPNPKLNQPNQRGKRLAANQRQRWAGLQVRQVNLMFPVSSVVVLHATVKLGNMQLWWGYSKVSDTPSHEKLQFNVIMILHNHWV